MLAIDRSGSNPREEKLGSAHTPMNSKELSAGGAENANSLDVETRRIDHGRPVSKPLTEITAHPF